MCIVQSEYICETLLVHGLPSTVCAAKNDLVSLTSVPAEMNDLWFVQQQQLLQIVRSRSYMLVQFEFIPMWTFMNSLEDLPGLFVDENAAGGPWIRGQK
jgi:hypothetical protein